MLPYAPNIVKYAAKDASWKPRAACYWPPGAQIYGPESYSSYSSLIFLLHSNSPGLLAELSSGPQREMLSLT